MTNITWTDDKRKLSQLIPWERNPRQIKGANVKRLQESFEEFGQPEPVIIGPNDELYNGHQRLKSWLSRFGDVEVAVRVASRPLTEKEREKLTVYLHKGATGEWDFEILANEFEIDELLEWGFESFELGIVADNDIEGEWQGMPEFEHEDLSAQYNVKVNFATLEDKRTFGKLIGQPLTEKTRSIWYPPAVIDTYADKRYSDES